MRQELVDLYSEVSALILTADSEAHEAAERERENGFGDFDDTIERIHHTGKAMALRDIRNRIEAILDRNL